MKNKKNNEKVNTSGFLRTALLFVLMVALCFSCGFFAPKSPTEVSPSDVVYLDSPDMALMGGWVFYNPEDDSQLLAFEFGPDSTFIVMNFADGAQVGETLTGKCSYLTVKGYKAIEMTLDSTGETMYYYYTVADESLILTNKETGEIMPLTLVKKVTIAE